MSTPSSSSRPATRTTVAGAPGSTSRTSPKPGLLAWWSTTTEVPAESSRPASSPRRAGEATSRLTKTSGPGATGAGAGRVAQAGRRPETGRRGDGEADEAVRVGVDGGGRQQPLRAGEPAQGG